MQIYPVFPGPVTFQGRRCSFITYSSIITCFVTRTVTDGLPDNDFKPIKWSAKYLFDCGYMRNIQVGNTNNLLNIKANCLPQMRKNSVYRLIISLQCDSKDVITATCSQVWSSSKLQTCRSTVLRTVYFF